jgi:endonuclease/exonuclease/phosphatase family metal-dependent hydrolase
MMKKVILFLTILCSASNFAMSQKNTPINVASYNLRMNTKSDGINAWPNRKENVKALLQYHDIDIFGTQEGFIGQLQDITTLPEYAFTGKGREDGQEKGEHSAIIYKKDRFKLLSTGDFWLSETPEVPGKGWDAKCCNRIASWGKFKDLKTKKEFFFFNVHFDHEGIEARRKSAPLMISKIQAIAAKLPVILTGDFNSTPETEQIKTLQGFLGDAYLVTKQPPYGPVGTFSGFKFNAPFNERIDYIFVSNSISVLKYGVLTDAKDQRYPSDHLPVVAKVVMK